MCLTNLSLQRPCGDESTGHCTGAPCGFEQPPPVVVPFLFLTMFGRMPLDGNVNDTRRARLGHCHSRNSFPLSPELPYGLISEPVIGCNASQACETRSLRKVWSDPASDLLRDGAVDLADHSSSPRCCVRLRFGQVPAFRFKSRASLRLRGRRNSPVMSFG